MIERWNYHYSEIRSLKIPTFFMLVEQLKKILDAEEKANKKLKKKR